MAAARATLAAAEAAKTALAQQLASRRKVEESAVTAVQRAEFELNSARKRSKRRRVQAGEGAHGRGDIRGEEAGDQGVGASDETQPPGEWLQE